MDDAKHMLDSAARLAWRSAGDVEPNPMVGAVIVRDGLVIGLGHHRRFGGLHAEREALADCRRRGEDPRGATVYVTLEPCCHHGKQPPCTDALIGAGVAKVVYARADPNPLSSGGAEMLRRAGVGCELSSGSILATRLSDPFVKRVTTGRPWVIAKWAQTADGRMITGPDEPRWISNELSRKRVHRLRARVDAIVTGIGTVRADDPLLTARGVRRVRRLARRVVIDPRAELPQESALLRTAPEAPVTLIHAGARPQSPARGVEYLSVPTDEGRIDLHDALRLLAERYDATNVLLECGPRLLASFLALDLVDEAIVHVAPGRSISPAAPADSPVLPAPRFGLVRTKLLAGDSELWYRRSSPPGLIR